MRIVCTKASTASISCSRPMNEVSCSGSVASVASTIAAAAREEQTDVSKLMDPLGSLDVLEAVDSHVVEPHACRHVIDDEFAGRL